MFPPYVDRLIVIGEMLKSPQSEIVEEACDLLFKLWLEYLSDSEFSISNDLKEIVKEHSNLMQVFEDRINKLPQSNEEKAILVEEIKLLYSPKALKKSQVAKKPSEKKEQEMETNVNQVEIASNPSMNSEMPKRSLRFETSVSESVASWIAMLISLAILIGGLSAGFSSSLGIMLSLVLIALAVFVFVYNIIKKDN